MSKHYSETNGAALCGASDGDVRAVWWDVSCRECIALDARPLVVTPGFFDKYYRPGMNMQRGRY